MLKDEITIKAVIDNSRGGIDYSDEDIVLKDSIRLVSTPSSLRLAMNCLFFILKGHAQVVVNGKIIKVEKNNFVICPPNIGISDFMISPDFEVRVLYFSSRILQTFLREKVEIWNEFVYSRKVHVVAMEGERFSAYTTFYGMLHTVIQIGVQMPFYNEIIRSMIGVGLLGLTSILYKDRNSLNSTLTSRPDKLFRQFLEILHNSSTAHCTVESLAQELCVSPKYLSNICKKNSGKTASAWIEERVMEEIRYYLRQTDMSVKQICYELGFSSPSFFSKYVRAHFNMTPLQLRRT